MAKLHPPLAKGRISDSNYSLFITFDLSGLPCHIHDPQKVMIFSRRELQPPLQAGSQPSQPFVKIRRASQLFQPRRLATVDDTAISSAPCSV